MMMMWGFLSTAQITLMPTSSRLLLLCSRECSSVEPGLITQLHSETCSDNIII